MVVMNGEPLWNTIPKRQTALHPMVRVDDPRPGRGGRFLVQSEAVIFLKSGPQAAKLSLVRRLCRGDAKCHGGALQRCWFGAGVAAFRFRRNPRGSLDALFPG